MNLWVFWGVSFVCDLARIQQCLCRWVCPCIFAKGQRAQGGAGWTQRGLWRSICSWQRFFFFYPQWFLVDAWGCEVLSSPSVGSQLEPVSGKGHSMALVLWVHVCRGAAAAKGCFPFPFHHFTDAEGCTGGARSGCVLKSLHRGLLSQQQWHFKSRVHIASESVSDPGLAVRNWNPSPKLHADYSFHFLGGNMLLFPKSS